MPLRNLDVYAHIEHALAGPLSDEIQPFDVLDQAADWLSGAHTWRFLRPGLAKLKLRGKITLTAATYTDSTRTLTLSAAFADYEYVAGDVVKITAASAGDLKEYAIESRTDDNSIVLKTPGFGADATGVGGTMSLHSVALPPDFQSLVAVSATDTVVNGLKLRTISEVMRLRTSELDVESSWSYVGALTWALDGDDAAVPILDIWPTPTTDTEDAFTIAYQRRIAVKDLDTAVIPIPANNPNLNLCLIRVARIIALGYEEGDEADSPSMDVRLAEFMAGPIWRAATRQDGLGQPTMGPMRGGGVQRARRVIRRLLSSEVEAPG